MKVILYALMVVAVVYPTVGAQPYVVADTAFGTLVCDGYLPGTNLWQVISICNPDSVQTDISLVFRVYHKSGLPLWDWPMVLYFNGIDTLFDSPISVSYLWIDSALEVAISMSTSTPGKGLPVSNDTIRYVGLRLLADEEHDTLCVDSTASDSLGGWLFIPGPNPTWSGEKCHPIGEAIDNFCFVVNFDNCISSFTYNPPYCATIGYTFHAINLCFPWVRYQVAYGPGVINPITGNWTYTPSINDAGQTLPSGIVASVDMCGDSSIILADTCHMQIHVAPNNPVNFVQGHPNVFVAATEETLAVSIETEDLDTCTDYRFSYYVAPDDPEPPGYLDTLTGVLYYYGTQADTGLYHIYLVVSEGEFADTTNYYVYHFESFNCGDMDHNGSVNIADLTWLVDFLFRGGPPPITYEAGNVDCVGGVNVADVTYIVDYLFRSGPPLCNNCP
jgi:hypothetical protein